MLLSDVDAHRADIAGVTALAGADLGSYAATVVDELPAKAAGQLRAASNAVISSYGETAAVAGALFYETNRPAPGFTASPVVPSIGEQVASELGWALVPLFAPDGFTDPGVETVSRLVAVSGKYVANADRETVIGAARKDRLSRGAFWFAGPDACAFCALMSAQRARPGGVRWHNNCHCVMVPAWAEVPIPDSDYMDRFAEAAASARNELEAAQWEHPDRALYAHNRGFLKAHPELSIRNRNITRVMREKYGFDH